MTYLTKTLFLGVACDKPSCDVQMTNDPKVRPYQWGPEVGQWLIESGWTQWVPHGRGSLRIYCPDHGPYDPSKMRQIV